MIFVIYTRWLAMAELDGKEDQGITITAQQTFASVSQKVAVVSYQRYLGSSHTSVSTMY